MTVIKPPGQPPIQPTGTETPPEPRALPSQPEPAKPTTPGDHDAYQAKSGASPLESHSPPQSLVKPSEHVGVIKPPVITVTGPISPPAIDASLLNALPEQDPNKLQVPIDRRLDEAKANLTTILEALKGQPPLIETHDRLTGELEALAMKHSLHAHQIDIHDANSNSPASHLSVESSRIQSETSELEAEISLLQEQIELTKNPTKYERLSSKSRALLAKLKDFPAIDTNFQQAFSAFVSDYGAEVAESHNLAQNIDVFRHNVDILKQNGKHLEDQRDHMRELLDRPMSAREFKRIENHINQLVSHFERQAHDVESFNQSTQEFVHFMDSLRENKAAAQAERAYVNQTKTQLLASLNEALDTDFDGSQLQASFADARDALGDQVLSEGGFTRNLEVLQNNLSNVENALHQVRSYAQMLKADVEKADHKGWVDARKENVEEVTQQLKQFHALKTQYESQLDSFLAGLNGLQEEAARAPIGEVQHQLQSRLDSLPKLIAVENPLQSYASDVRSLSPAIQQEATQIGEHFQRLNQSANILTEKVSALERKITNAKNHGDLKAARDNLKTLHSLFKRHNSDVRTQQQLADRILDKIPGLTESQRANMNVPAISENGKTLLDRVSRGPDPFFSTMNITSLSYSDGRKITFSTDQRIAVWDSLLKNDTSLDINQLNRSGNTMIHQIIMSAGMAESDKSRMVQYLVSRGADLNRKNQDGLLPVELGLRLSVRQPELIETLRDLGAKLSLEERIPIFAHLIGAGGEVSLKKNGQIQRVALEGLSPTFASYGLDPAFVESLDELQDRTEGPIHEIYQRMERGWVNTMSYEKFIGRVRDAKLGIDTQGGVPEVLSTGWDHPSGHAISFVFNHEPDGYYFYACNTGDAKDPERSIVKYKVSDFDGFLRFLKTASRDSDHTRSLYVGRPERLGLERVSEDDQLPVSIDKSSQKIGNCTVASRKAALLAMMWSEGRDFSIPPEELKAAYKEVTTELRERGVRGAIASGHMELMGKSLVKMLTKFDRPACQGYAFELASAMVRKSEGQPSSLAGMQHGAAPPSNSSDYLRTLERAVRIGDLNLEQRERNGRTLAENARSEGNQAAARILDTLSQAA